MLQGQVHCSACDKDVYAVVQPSTGGDVLAGGNGEVRMVRKCASCRAPLPPVNAPTNGASTSPEMAMPAAAVAAGVALFVLLKKKRSNPARRPGLRRAYMYEVAEVAPGGARVGHTSVVAYSRDHAKHVYAKEHGKSPGTTVKVYKTP